MIARGDRQHDIAAYFAVNGGRIGETSTGEHFAGVMAQTSNLPPAAPYLVIDADLMSDAKSVLAALKKMGAASNVVEAQVRVLMGMEESSASRQGK
jgi:hypothetical protein